MHFAVLLFDHGQFRNKSRKETLNDNVSVKCTNFMGVSRGVYLLNGLHFITWKFNFLFNK